MFSSKRMVLLLAMLAAFGPMSLDLYLPAFPSVASDFGTDTSSVQFTMTTFLVGIATGQLLWGPTSDRFGRRRPLLVGLGLYIASSLLITIAPNFWTLVALRVAQGLGGASGIVIGRAIVRDMFSGTDLARAISIVVSVFAVTPVIAPVIGSLILFIAPWQGLFAFQSLFGIACLIGVTRMTETLDPQRRTSHGFIGAMSQYGGMLRERTFLVSAAIAGFGSAAIQAFISASPIAFMDGFGTSEFAFSLIFAGSALFFTFGAQINRRLVRSHTPRSVLRLSLWLQILAGALGSVAAVLDTSLAVYLLPVLLINLASAGVTSNIFSIALEPYPHAAASAAALVGTSQMLTSGLMAAVLSVSMLPGTLELPLFSGIAAALAFTLLVMRTKQ